MGAAFEQGARVAVGTDETGGIADPAIDQLFHTPLGKVVENACAPQGMQVTVGVEAQLRRAVVPVGQLLAGVTKRLEVADGVGMFEHDEFDGPFPFCRLCQPRAGGDRCQRDG